MRIKRLIALALLLSGTAVMAQNTFPTNGSVGIGTTTPSARLDVNGNMIVDSSLVVKDSVRFNDKLTVEKDAKFKGETVFKGFTKVDDDLKIIGETKMKGDAFVEGDFKFKSLADPNATNDRFLIINGNGKVKDLGLSGINEITYGSSCFPLQGGANTFYLAPAWQAAGGPNITDSRLFTGIDCPAHVGIGTDQPAGNLDVNGTSFFRDKTVVGSTQTFGSKLAIDMSINPSQLNAFFVNGANSSPDFIVSSNGNTGVGLFNPSYKLHLRANTAGSLPLLIENDNDELMKLDHDGLLQVREVKVTLQPFADYVFDDDYKLMSIEETESFIIENGHLPNMPSAQEVDENGIGVGELQLKQQEKIEELTLYVIQLKKELDALKQELNEQKDK